jgi:hypothetical protein
MILNLLILVFFREMFNRKAFKFKNRRAEMGKEKLKFTLLTVTLYVN